MPLQPSSHGFFRPLLKGMHVLRQKEVVHQALGNTTPSPFSHTRTLALARRGLLSSWEEEARFIPT